MNAALTFSSLLIGMVASFAAGYVFGSARRAQKRDIRGRWTAL